MSRQACVFDLLSGGIQLHCGTRRQRRKVEDPSLQNKDNMNWYYAQGDERKGPVSEAEFDALIAAGTITENTLVWKEGMANWAPLKESRPVGAGGETAPPGWIRCTATGRFFPPEEIVYIEGKPYSAAAKASVMQGLMQTGSMPEADFGRTGPAWENRSQLGFFRAMMQTIKGVLFDPAVTFERMKREGGLGAPLLFMVLVGSVTTLVSIGYNLVFNINMQNFVPAASRQTFAAQAGLSNMVLAVVGAVLTPFIIAILYGFIASGVFHLSLMLCAGIRRPFETTFRTNCYGFGATSIWYLVPFCGGFIAPIWWIVALCIGMAKTHEITTGKSVFGVLLPVAVCCFTCLAFYGVLIAFVVSAAQSGRH
jgi:hypothetical protein